MQGPATLQLKRFDIEKTDDRRVVVLIGKRNTGKSTLAAEWLYSKRHIPVGIVMSSTEEATGFFKKQCGIPDSFIYNEFNADVIQKVIDKQKAIYKAGKTRKCFIVLDDVMFDAKAIFSERCIRDLFMNSRHYGVFLLITAQTLELPVYARGNTDYVCVLREPTNFAREKMYKTMFSIFPTYKYFCQVMDACTENYECLVLDNTSQSNALTDNVFWFRAKIRADHTWRMGGAEYHSFHTKHYRPNANPAKPTIVAKPTSVNIVKMGEKRRK